MKALSGRAKVSAKGWVVIPKEIRDEMGLQPGDEVRFTLAPPPLAAKQDARLGSLRVHKALSAEEVLDATYGMIPRTKGEPSLTEALLGERQQEVALEERRARDAQKKKRRTSA